MHLIQRPKQTQSWQTACLLKLHVWLPSLLMGISGKQGSFLIPTNFVSFYLSIVEIHLALSLSHLAIAISTINCSTDFPPGGRQTPWVLPYYPPTMNSWIQANRPFSFEESTGYISHQKNIGNNKINRILLN